MQQTVLDNFKLKFTHTADDLFITAKLGKQLGHTFVG